MTDREAIARFEPYIGNECYRKEFQEACVCPSRFRGQ